jgi:hypothetical protein
MWAVKASRKGKQGKRKREGETVLTNIKRTKR